jgi:ferredoxin-type protein NapG
LSSGWANSFLRRIFGLTEGSLTNQHTENRLRPPGAVDEKRFMCLCIRCNRCLEVCPYNSIRRAGLGATIGTPYVFPLQKACYLCMACCRLCPTGALDRGLSNPESVAMGKARIDTSVCYSHLFLDHDVLPENAGTKIGALCNTCYNVCPFPDKAIALQQNLFPVILEGCVGCGICTERCPTRPRRAINVIPAGMGRVDEAGFYFGKARKHFESTVRVKTDGTSGALKGDKLLEQKALIERPKDQPKFEFPYKVPNSIEGWD